MIRNMTPEEQDDFVAIFPSLNAGLQPRVTGEVTPFELPGAYNCIAWTVGIDDDWINPKQSIEEWDNFYAGYGFEQADAGTIAVWKRGGIFTHGSVANAAHGFNWESKCGENLRILHENAELVSNVYGNVFMYYARAENADTAQPAVSAAAKAPAMNEKQKAILLHDAVKTISPAVREEFNQLFDAWKRTWAQGTMAFSNNARDRSAAYSYKQLVEMGPEILPLVVEKLANPENFIARQLYNDLQAEAGQKVAIEPGVHRNHGEKLLARQTVERFLQARNK
ncbi:MAG TPA: hypothetical protein VMI53_10315 [Opitutaceae bacterium]|nr:hypothetical protein [Opitutaceae bacterium]